MKQSMRSPEAGYSLTEMLTVVAIIGILSLVMVPNFIGYYQSNKMKTSMRNLTTDLRTVRQLAITQGKQAALVYGTGSAQRTYNYYLGDKPFGSTTWRPQTGLGATRYARTLDDIAYFPTDAGNTRQSFPTDLLKCDTASAPTYACTSGKGLTGNVADGGDTLADVVFYPDGRAQLPAGSSSGAITIQTDLTRVPNRRYAVTISPSGRTEALPEMLYANLGSPADGTVYFCSDCAAGSPCGSSGTGSTATRKSGAWVCN